MSNIPSIGITRRESYDSRGVHWSVDVAACYLTTAQARVLAAEILNAADIADGLNEKIKADKPQ